MNAQRGLMLALLIAIAGAAYAGTACEMRTATPTSVAAAAATALRVRDALDAADAPIALVARVGTDLSRHGLVYSHVGFALRDHPDGRWTVIHLLNRCGTDDSSLYAEGLVNFFADDLVNQDARIVWLTAPDSERLLRRLHDATPFALHQARYNVIARPGSRNYQNSTSWALEMLAASHLAQPRPTRAQAQALSAANGHEPDIIRIPYSKRVLGGLFGANLAFTDHPIGTRLSGQYPVTTVRSILRWLRSIGAVASEREWRNGAELARLGPD